MPNVTKRDLILDIAKSTGFTQSQIKKVLEEFLTLVTESLAQQKNIEIRGFGTFHVKKRKARAARNPKTGESVQLDESFAPLFKFSSDLRKLIDEAYDIEPVISSQTREGFGTKSGVNDNEHLVRIQK